MRHAIDVFCVCPLALPVTAAVCSGDDAGGPDTECADFDFDGGALPARPMRGALNASK